MVLTFKEHLQFIMTASYLDSVPATLQATAHGEMGYLPAGGVWPRAEHAWTSTPRQVPIPVFFCLCLPEECCFWVRGHLTLVLGPRFPR